MSPAKLAAGRVDVETARRADVGIDAVGAKRLDEGVGVIARRPLIGKRFDRVVT